MISRSIELAAECPQSVLYAVGCLLASEDGEVLASGFTGELSHSDTAMHAEEVAITKARQAGHDLGSLSLYSTMEPCSERRSGHAPCSAIIVEANLRRVIYGTAEPFNRELGIVCKGRFSLEEAGIEVVQVRELEKACLEAALRGKKI